MTINLEQPDLNYLDAKGDALELFGQMENNLISIAMVAKIALENTVNFLGIGNVVFGSLMEQTTQLEPVYPDVRKYAYFEKKY